MTETTMIDYYILWPVPQGLDNFEATRRTDSPFSFAVDFQSTNPSEQPNNSPSQPNYI